MRNLRLTEADANSALLAKSMSGEDSLISNITLEGEIASGSGNLGALINTVSGGEVNTVTSMVKIDNDATYIGGIVGQISASAAVKIAYCSNYGPLSTTSTGAGGIVGRIASGSGSLTIDHCFNGSALLAGYTYTGTNETNNNYYAGGIVGNINAQENNITIQVSHCYNAGIIKAGHKKNGAITYAAGIVAHSEITDTNKVQISNCYNEGSIEALGKDPEISYTDSLKLTQSNNKNVSAYYIADIGVTNCDSIGLNTDSPANGNETYLKRNGAILNAGEEYYTINATSYDYINQMYTYYDGSTTAQNTLTDNGYTHSGSISSPDIPERYWGGEITTNGFRLYYSMGVAASKLYSFSLTNRKSNWQILQQGINNIPILLADWQEFTITMNEITFSEGYANSVGSGQWALQAGGWQSIREIWSETVADLFVYDSCRYGDNTTAVSIEQHITDLIYPSGTLLATGLIEDNNNKNCQPNQILFHRVWIIQKKTT